MLVDEGFDDAGDDGRLVLLSGIPARLAGRRQGDPRLPGRRPTTARSRWTWYRAARGRIEVRLRIEPRGELRAIVLCLSHPAGRPLRSATRRRQTARAARRPDPGVRVRRPEELGTLWPSIEPQGRAASRTVWNRQDLRSSDQGAVGSMLAEPVLRRNGIPATTNHLLGSMRGTTERDERGFVGGPRLPGLPCEWEVTAFIPAWAGRSRRGAGPRRPPSRRRRRTSSSSRARAAMRCRSSGGELHVVVALVQQLVELRRPGAELAGRGAAGRRRSRRSRTSAPGCL